MPITVTCEHCSEKACYASQPNHGDEEFTLQPLVIVTKNQRHICNKPSCLVKEIESQSAKWGDRFHFYGGVR